MSIRAPMLPCSKSRPEDRLPTVHAGDPSRVKVGQWVAAIGSPFGFENSISAGIVSAKGAPLPDGTYVPFIQTDVAVNPGNSGGPLFNMARRGGRHQLADLQPHRRTTWACRSRSRSTSRWMWRTSSQTQGKVHTRADRCADPGNVRRLAKSFGLEQPTGALVSSVERMGRRDKAGFKTGDVILEFNGRAVSDSRELPLIAAP